MNPLIVGHGLAGQAIETALSIVKALEPDLPLGEIKFADRNLSPLDNLKARERTIPFIANPHGLHTPWLLATQDLDIPMVFCEKPIAVSQEQLNSLKNLRTRVAVFHGYRMMWGPQTMKRMIDQGEIGKVFGVECRYWQASQAGKYLDKSDDRSQWKSTVELAGPCDVLLDLGTHWVDLVRFLWTSPVSETSIQKFYPHTSSPYRDSHVTFHFTGSDDSYAMGSASKSAHGAGNELDITVLGSRRSLTWKFSDPDRLEMGQGRERLTITRTRRDVGSSLPSFHSLGWIEGYVETIRQGLREMITKETGQYPSLSDSLATLSLLLNSSSRD